MLTTYDLDEYVFEALRAGASGFLLKDCPPDTLISGIATVARGDALLAPSVTRRLITEFARRPPQSAPRALPGLTPRETEVLIQVARGLSNREIASQLFLGEATIKTYVGNILMKLGCRDRVQAVVAAYEAGLAEGIPVDLREAALCMDAVASVPRMLNGGVCAGQRLYGVDRGGPLRTARYLWRR